jgi:DNA-binding CsgD family transcriptional regulator
MSLTTRQHQILALIALGLTNADISMRLGCAEKTVKAHVTPILKALNVPNRTSAALAFHGLPWGPDAPEPSPALVAPTAESVAFETCVSDAYDPRMDENEAAIDADIEATYQDRDSWADDQG